MKELFVAYLPANGKIPLVSVLNEDNWLSQPPATGDYVGILHPDYVQVDVDNSDDAELIKRLVEDKNLRTDILKTTRGYHFYFLNDGIKTQSVGQFNAMGIETDIGLGDKNRVVPLRETRDFTREDGSVGVRTITREWLQQFDELDTIPPYLMPISNRDFGLRTTQTRNQTLFNYILTLQTHKFSKDDVRKTIRVINDYVLYEPLSDREIDTITRDDAFSQELFFTDRGAFIHDRFGNYMLSNSNVMIIDGKMCIYTKDNIYSHDPDDFERVMLSKIPQLKDNQRKEVYRYMYLKCNRYGEYSHPKYIGLKDSILDIQTMELYPYSPSFIINNKIQYNYNPNAYSEAMDTTLNNVSCGDQEIRTLLEEMIGYSLYRANTMQTAFILTGGGRNGKSTILDVIKRLLGKENYTSLDLRELEGTFEPAELYNKLANIGDDISAKYLDTSSAFKKVVTGESFMVQKKYGQPFELENYSTQIFCANELPPVSDKSEGFSRRITIIPFNARFHPSDVGYDPFIEDKLQEDESMEYLLALAIDGLRNVLYNKEFTKTTAGELEKMEYIMSNNNVLQWINEQPKIENEAVSDVYLAYRQWCLANGVNPVKRTNMGREITDQLGLVSKPRYIDGKTTRVYVKE